MEEMKMKTEYIGTNKYRYRFFKTPLGYTKFLLDVFINPNYINMTETNINGSPSDEDVRRFALSEIKRIESME